jgi:hypothetical protein
MSNCHRQTLPVFRYFVTSQCIDVLFGTFLSRYALLNTLQTAENDLDAKQCSRMNTHSAREYTMFASAQFLRNWREQRPSNKGDLDSSVTGEVRSVYYTGADLLLIQFLTVVRDCCWIAF